MQEEKDLEQKYLTKVKDQMQKISTKENKLGDQFMKLLPVKLHLKAWEDKLNLKEKTSNDAFVRKLQSEKEQKFEKLLEQLYAMEWNKLREENQ